jgi:hypothetical protein
MTELEKPPQAGRAGAGAGANSRLEGGASARTLACYSHPGSAPTC